MIGEAASADEEAAGMFVSYLNKIIANEGYLAEQIFNVDETRMFRKGMLTRTYINKETQCLTGFKVSKDNMTTT